MNSQTKYVSRTCGTCKYENRSAFTSPCWSCLEEQQSGLWQPKSRKPRTCNKRGAKGRE